ncbi:MAG: deoxyguanosinetriphosphate triphosphohydrolase [Rickettsiaceae bacterium]|nr:deoxyguanosinetriphosphate triphosphohydrolase [Rickettsiaceae bacterium]
MLKSYACKAENSRGRLYPEKTTPYRNEFERDRDRIIHANAFKRLQYKTQVFVNHEGDHYRNRLTHSIEVSTISRSVSKALGLSEDLSEAVALAHDLGHTPFGHAGEIALNLCMKNYGGFSHNAHSFKLLTYIEQRYASYDGLNLTWEVLEGIVKHNGPIIHKKEEYQYVFDYDAKHDLDLARYSSAEAQVAAMSDDIAYICHDFEDGIKAEILTEKQLCQIELLAKFIHEVRTEHITIDSVRLIYEVGRKLMHHFVKSVLEQTRENLQKYNIQSEQQIRNLNCNLVDFTPEVYDQIKIIKSFMREELYTHHKVLSVSDECKNIIEKLFTLYADNTLSLPTDWNDLLRNNSDEKYRMSVIADYIAGMTDRFAIKQYKSYYKLNSNTLKL